MRQSFKYPKSFSGISLPTINLSTYPREGSKKPGKMGPVIHFRSVPVLSKYSGKLFSLAQTPRPYMSETYEYSVYVLFVKDNI